MHLTLRLSRELARAVSRWARAHGVAKSQVVRDAVASYVGLASPGGAQAEHAPIASGRALSSRWATLPHLSVAEAGGLAGGIAASRSSVPRVTPPWE
ncbi:MAG TPA: CopG family transcriptional regulator [Gemmatimonadaceae bacterium]|nr:CopG family transcriptional regulator [Gemmatimonadaceae bacterium]